MAAAKKSPARATAARKKTAAKKTTTKKATATKATEKKTTAPAKKTAPAKTAAAKRAVPARATTAKKAPPAKKAVARTAPAAKTPAVKPAPVAAPAAPPVPAAPAVPAPARGAAFDDDAVWARLERNEHEVALAHDLIQPGERFTLTEDQGKAVEQITRGLDDGTFEWLLQAPTGSGKTEVLLRVALDTILMENGYVVMLAPTRDLIRQHVAYFTERLEGTGIGVATVHGGVEPRDRDRVYDDLGAGVRVVIGSAMLLTNDRWWNAIDRASLLVVDDVNAFDEREHLRLLEPLDCPVIFATATPAELRGFLDRVGATRNVVRMKKMPFDVLPTKVHEVTGVWGEPPTEQLARADVLIRDHLDRGSRIFVIGRTRSDIPRLAERLETTYGLPVQQLRGDMADTSEQGNRYRRRGVKVHGSATRVEMMRAFRESAPSILAATNLVGSGLDVPAADLIVVTDADAFGEAEIEQLVGRVGRRERPSDAVLLTGTTFATNPSRAMGPSGRAKSFMPRGKRAGQFKFGRGR